MRRSLLFSTILAMCCLPAHSLQIRTEKLPWAIVGQPYRAEINTGLDDRCIAADVRFTLTDGSLPRGLSLDVFGVGGTPREVGRFQFTIRAANQCVAVEKTIELFVTGKPVLDVSPGELVFEYHVGGPLPWPGAVLVTSTWPGLPYGISANGVEWVRAEPASGVTPDSGSALRGDAVTVRIHPEKLNPGTYRTTLVFSTWLGANAPEIPVTLKVVE
jgi:Putative Ig domain